MLDFIHSLDFWRTASLGFAALGQTFFVCLYATFPWWRTFLGRALFYKAVILMALTDFVLLSRILQIGGEDILFIVLYAMLGFGIWWQALAFVGVKRQGNERALADAERAVRDAQQDIERGHHGHYGERRDYDKDPTT